MTTQIKYIEKILTSREKKLFKIAILVFVLWLFYWIFSPKIIELNDKRRRLTMANLRLAAEEHTYKDSSVNWIRAQEESALLTAKVPAQNPTSNFLIELEIWSHEVSAQMILVDCLGPATEGELPLKIHLRGKLSSLLYIIERLEGYPTAIDLDDIEFFALNSTHNDGGLSNGQLFSVPATADWGLKVSVVLYYHEKLSNSL